MHDDDPLVASLMMQPRLTPDAVAAMEHCLAGRYLPMDDLIALATAHAAPAVRRYVRVLCVEMVSEATMLDRTTLDRRCDGSVGVRGSVVLDVGRTIFGLRTDADALAMLDALAAWRRS